jgi:predicted RNA binding protein YcfA (HicA-like mRNA interferase family)
MGSGRDRRVDAEGGSAVAQRRDEWIETRKRGSHRRLRKGERLRTWTFHDSMDLGSVQMAQIARQFGYTPKELLPL